MNETNRPAELDLTADMNGPYTMASVKKTRTFADLTLEEAIEKAKAHDEEYQPAYGTELTDARGNVVWSSESDDGPSRADRRADIIAALAKYDDGTGTLGTVVDQALADDPDVTVDDVREIIDEAIEDAAASDQGAFAIGDRVEGGTPGSEDYDTGRVTAVAGDQITVAWDSGVATTQAVSGLRAS